MSTLHTELSTGQQMDQRERSLEREQPIQKPLSKPTEGGEPCNSLHSENQGIPWEISH